jgi:hypothetical protein
MLCVTGVGRNEYIALLCLTCPYTLAQYLLWAVTLLHCLQAADMLRVTGIGRNEYIALMNACKAKKLLCLTCAVYTHTLSLTAASAPLNTLPAGCRHAARHRHSAPQGMAGLLRLARAVHIDSNGHFSAPLATACRPPTCFVSQASGATSTLR